MQAPVMKLRATGDAAPKIRDPAAQRKQVESGQFLLQVDRQTKASYATVELAHTAGLAIKARHPVVQVSIYDSVERRNTLVELPGTPALDASPTPARTRDASSPTAPR